MLLLALLACKSPDEAPPTLDEMSSALLVDFEVEDREIHAQTLADWLVAHADDAVGYSLSLLEPSMIEGMQPQPAETDLAAQLGIGVVHRVEGSLEQHAAIVPEPDQSFADSTYERWDRTLVEGTEASYLAGGLLRTENFIEKGGAFGVMIPYPMNKDYHWVQLTQGDTLIFRSWSTEMGCADMGNNCLRSGFTIEVWVPDPAGLIWYNASWSELVTDVDGLISEDYKRQEIVDGTVDYMEGTAAHAVGADE